MGGIIREEEITLTMVVSQTTEDTRITEDTLMMEDTLIMEGTQIMVDTLTTMDTQTTMDTLIMEDIPITEVIQVTVLIVGNCNPSLVEVEHLGLMIVIPRSPLTGDNNFHFRTFVMKFNS